jgi:hypothetical protein
MNDPYPAVLRIEIDRQRLKSYFLADWLMSWTLPVSLLFVFIGALLGMTPEAQAFALNVPAIIKGVIAVTAGALIGFATGFVFTFIPYVIFRYRRDVNVSKTLELSVEGSFLRLRVKEGGWSDRKLHFRSIVDYAVFESSLMRKLRIQCLVMRTTGGYSLMVPGVVDCFAVRDKLSEIDRLREGQ